VYHALFTLLPDDLEYGLLLASAQTRGGKAEDALSTVGALRRLPAPPRDDPRIDLREAQAAGGLSDFAHTRRAAHAAAEKAGRQGARLQYARARLLESGAMQNLATAGFADVRAEARHICAELGDRACVAAAYRIEANVFALGDLPALAKPLYASVLQIANEIGNQLEKLNALTGLGYTEQRQGDLQAAERVYRAALAVASEMGTQKRPSACHDLAEVLAAEGRIAESRALGQEALEGSFASREQETIGLSHAVLAQGLAYEGRFPEALAKYTEAVRILRDVHAPVELATALLDQGEAQMEHGDMTAARRSFEEARDLGHQYSFAGPEIEMAFARLSLAAGQTDDAAAKARSAMNTFTTAGREGDRLQAGALLARALIARGDIGEASRVLAQLPSPDGLSLPIAAVVRYRLARCFVVANSGRRAEASLTIDRIAGEASHLGLIPLEKEARLAREELMKTANLFQTSSR
jgi:tetratricopeptide (TPR) repeat protein